MKQYFKGKPVFIFLTLFLFTSFFWHSKGEFPQGEGILNLKIEGEPCLLLLFFFTIGNAFRKILQRFQTKGNDIV